jgi:TatD DNase family protein
MTNFYDTHAHLDFPDFVRDLPETLERAAAAGISKVITIGTDFESSRRALALAREYPPVYAVVGWHPSHVTAAPEDVRPELRKLAREPKVVAIGETGLDYHRLPADDASASTTTPHEYRLRQRQLFDQQMEVAVELGLNCVVHQRDAFDDVLAAVKPFAGALRAVFHCFGGTPDQARQILDLGGLVSFTGIVTFRNAEQVRATAASVPVDRFMLETDCPYLAPVPFRGKRCEPAHVRPIAEAVAQARGCSLDELSAMTCRTATEFFRGLSSV